MSILTKTSAARMMNVKLRDVEHMIKCGSLELVNSAVTGVNGVSEKSIREFLGLTIRREDKYLPLDEMSVDEAAKVLGVNPSTVRSYATNGAVIRTKNGIGKDSVYAYKKKRDKKMKDRAAR